LQDTNIISKHCSKLGQVAQKGCCIIYLYAYIACILILITSFIYVYRKKRTNCSDDKPPVHIYEDVDKFSPLYEEICTHKTGSDSSSITENKVVFEKSKILPPGYSSSTLLQSNSSKKSNKENLNDYQIVFGKSSSKDDVKDTVDNNHQEDDTHIHCK